LGKRFCSSSEKLQSTGGKLFPYYFFFFFFNGFYSVFCLARPPAIALGYLVDLVTKIQQSSGRGDPRTDDQIAHDLDLSPIFLISLKDSNPQQSALNLFNHLYPGYEAKVTLGSVNNLEASKPGLFNTILGNFLH